MKKLLLVMALIVPALFSACSSDSQNSVSEIKSLQSETEIQTTTSEALTLTTASTTTTAPATTTTTNTPTVIPSYEEIESKVEAFFRIYYAHLEDIFTRSDISSIETSMGSEVVCYQTDMSMETSFKFPIYRFDLNCYGETGSTYYEYYMISDDMVYLIVDRRMSMGSPDEKYKEYFIINEKTWQYSEETGGLVETPEEYDQLEQFEITKKDVEKAVHSETITVQGIPSLPDEDNLFTQFNKLKCSFFRDFYSVDVYKRQKVNIEFLDYTLDNDNVTGFFDDTELKKLQLWFTEKTNYFRYDYYLIDDTNIYVIAYKEEYLPQRNGIYKRSQYFEEYFIIDGKVMEYDTEKQDLVDSAENSDILTYFKTAKEKVMAQ